MKPIIIFDNIIYSLQKVGGISAFWSNLTRRVEDSGLFECHYVEYKNSTSNIFRQSLDIPSDKIISGKSLPLGVHRILEPYIPPHLTQKPFIFHSSYYRTFRHPRSRIVSTFHDLTHEHGGDGNFITRPLMRSMHQNTLSRSSHVVCVSRHCQQDVKRVFPKFSDKSVSVAYNAPVINSNMSGVYASSEAQSNQVTSKDYLLFIGARDDYKNFRFAVELAELTNRTLVVAGVPFSKKEERWLKGIRAEIKLRPFPTTDELEELYSGAHALIFMSEYEGFGIPLVEAQSYGCPVLALRRSAVPEVAGEGAVLFNDLNLNEAKSEIERLDDIVYRRSLIERGYNNAKRFDWNKTAEHYINIYKKLLGL